MNKSEAYSFNSISNQTTITGDVEFSHPTNIFGNVIGNIKVNTDDQLILYSDSSVKGDIHCYDIEIQGTVEGNIYSRGVITVKSSGLITGSIQSKSLVVYPGSQLNLEAHCGQ